MTHAATTLTLTDPLIANTPQFELELVSDPNIQLVVVNTETLAEVNTVSVDLERSNENSESRTNASSREATKSFTSSIGQSTEISASASYPWGASVSVSNTFSFEQSTTHGYAQTQANEFTSGSIQASSEAYGEAVEESRAFGREISGGTIEAAIAVRNAGDITFTLTDIEVTALFTGPDGTFTPLTSLAISEQLTADGVSLGPNASAGPLVATGQLSADEALMLLAHPENLQFAVANVRLNYQNSDNGGARPLLDFEYLRQETNAKTAFVQLDFGNGTIVRKRVATNVARENGEIVGATVTSLLDVMGISYTTETVDLNGVPVKRLSSITDPIQGTSHSNIDDENQAWVLVGSTTHAYEKTTNVDDIRLLGGNSLFIMFVRDEDGDLLFSNEEVTYGTSDTNPDFDGDGLPDGQEVKFGWRVFRDDVTLLTPAPPYNENTLVFSDPTLPDADNDGLNDSQERDAATDPNNHDTDGDLYCDGLGAGPQDVCLLEADPDPLDPFATGNRVPVTNVAKIASFLFSRVELELTITDEELHEIVVEWGDGETTALPAPVIAPGVNVLEHFYVAEGTYPVTFTVRDTVGQTTAGMLQAVAVNEDLSLVAEYLFSGSSNGGEFVDSSGNGFDVDDRGADCTRQTTDRFGFADSALLWKGDCNPDNEGDLSSRMPNLGIGGAAEDGTYAFTFIAWTLGSGNVILLQGNNEDNEWGVFEQIFSGRNESRMGLTLPEQGGGESLVVFDTQPSSPNNFWNLYAVSVEGDSGATSGNPSATARLYRGVLDSANQENTILHPPVEVRADGNFANPRANAGSTATEDLWSLGHRSGDSLPEFSVDDVRIYNRALSDSDIRALFTIGFR